MTIAEKHLSKHGRFGDTEIASTSNGELWHVNKFEKKLINDYGDVGERLVDISGAGTINPTTGLKEQYVQAGLMAAQLGLSLFQGASQASMQRETAKEKSKLTQSQLKGLGNFQNALADSTQSQLDLLTTKSEMDKEKLSEQLKKITESVSQSKSKIGFSYSSDIDNELDEQISKVRSDEESLMATYGAKFGDVLGMFESEKSRIKSEKERLKSEQKLYESMSEQKFLGIF
jgi:small-conductance mechanosensitive channel